MNYKDIPDKDRIMKQSIRDANEEQRKMMTNQNILDGLIKFVPHPYLEDAKKWLSEALSQQKVEYKKEFKKWFKTGTEDIEDAIDRILK